MNHFSPNNGTCSECGFESENGHSQSCSKYSFSIPKEGEKCEPLTKPTREETLSWPVVDLDALQATLEWEEKWRNHQKFFADKMFSNQEREYEEICFIRSLLASETAKAREEERAKHTTEWLCEKCKVIHPTQREGKILQPCPECGMAMMPTSYDMREIQDLKKAVQESRAATIREIVGMVDRELSIHKQLEGECIGKIEDIQAGRKTDNPHTFVIEQIELIRTILENLLAENKEI